jgi:hypothetical protein
MKRSNIQCGELNGVVGDIHVHSRERQQGQLIPGAWTSMDTLQVHQFSVCQEDTFTSST